MNLESGKVSLKAIVLGVLVFVGMTVVLTWAIESIGADRIRSAIEQAGPLGPVVYILVRVATFVAAPLSSGPILFSAGVLFGFEKGLIYSLLGEIIGGTVNFWIARRFGRPVVSKLVGQDGMTRIDGFYSQFGEWWALVYARLFLFSVYDFISYAAGFTPMKYRYYALVTAIVGIIPTGVSVYIGTTMTEGVNSLIGLYVALAVLSIIPLFFYNRIRRLFARLKPLPVENPPSEI
jgi:uncharacterized membrane protein YdjX (TVP38/TMEM64 family)